MERQRHETDQVATAINQMSSAAQEVARSAQGASVAAQQTDAEGQAAKRVVAGSIVKIHALVDDIRSSGVSLDSLQKGTVAAVDAMRRSSDAGDGTSAQANQAGASLDTMAQLIGTINSMNAQIASAAEEQTAVAEEINRSVHQIAVAVDSVADETQLGAQTSRSLADLGQRLGQLVGQFRI